MSLASGIRAWARSRWVIVPGIMLVVTLGWLAYVNAHDHGVVEGRVVDAAGQPVAGATVQLFERGFVTHQERGRATSDEIGRASCRERVSVLV